MALANVLLSVSVELKRLGAKSQQKTMRGRGTDGLQRCSGSDHEPYAQTDHNKRNSTTKQSESRTNRPRTGKLRLAKRQPETIVIGRLNEKEEKQEAEAKAKSASSRARAMILRAKELAQLAKLFGLMILDAFPNFTSFVLRVPQHLHVHTPHHLLSRVSLESGDHKRRRGAQHRGQERRRPSSWLAVFTGRLVQGIDIPCLII